MQEKNEHIPVLLKAVLSCVSPKKGESFLDLTAGYGGHSKEIISLTSAPEKAVLVDRDENAISQLQQFKKLGTKIVHSDFLGAVKSFNSDMQKFDIILMDLGISSPHLDNPERGFSFQSEGPLDMRMDSRQQLTAERVVNDYSQDDLERVLRDFGEERHAKRVASRIVEARPIETTLELAEIVRRAVPGKRKKTHPATKTFQAIRLEVNQELRQLELSLPHMLNLLNPGGRVAIISFHSLEDRIVKRFFKEESESGYESRLEVLTRKPVSGTDDVFNPRARSAKLRVALKK